jgi:hypothetical protein
MSVAADVERDDRTKRLHCGIHVRDPGLAAFSKKSAIFPFRRFAATGDAVAQIDSLDGERVVAASNLEGRGAR